MNTLSLRLCAPVATLLALASCAATSAPDADRGMKPDPTNARIEAPAPPMNLGAFSTSLSVKDLAASRAFYTKLGFEVTGGDEAQNWLVLRNGGHVIGLFHGMFEKNMLTFNPGWNQGAEGLGDFTDIRELQQTLEAQGVELTSKADASTKGPASFTLIDPDGNPILIDQHVPAPQ